MVLSAARANILMPDLIRALDDAVIRRLTGFHALHAGAVLLGEQALLLPAVTHAGKSSPVAELLLRGATYFSDEYALIDSAGRVHPYPRPLLLRNGSPEQSPWLQAECNAHEEDNPAPVGWILALEYLSENTWSVTAVCQSEALLIFLRNTPHILSESPNMVAASNMQSGAPNVTLGAAPKLTRLSAEFYSWLETHFDAVLSLPNDRYERPRYRVKWRSRQCLSRLGIKSATMK